MDDVFNFVSVLGIAQARGVQAEAGRISAGEFARLGLPLISGCERCHATLGPGDAYPTRTGFIQCGDCLEGSDLGFISVADFEAFEAARTTE